ncbi:hypothetical protein BBF96_10465 [Anoxybacter fermentans]|uniref:Uncharacterized protein n=1 Tax=Anoxybacter fermentans TaxID=1323375 RepID=A0A3Q9HRM9_9FIRM|nr:hypothetical protein [Anoxybacter fermentans]AZR73771.1 hypothetical protein BBF96_10465 [Anoxybacter fermentans]
MKFKIYCHSCEELARYLDELVTYFNKFGLIPRERDYVALPGDGILRIRFDKNEKKAKIIITLDWDTARR